MIVGIFAEGRADLAVISNILKGWLGSDRSDLRYELPEYEYDQTDLSKMREREFSSWTMVKKTCVEKERIEKFFNNPIQQESFIVLHLDSAERHREDYNVSAPIKSTVASSKEYCNQLRANIINKINEWLVSSYSEKIAYAITIEETDAWVLTVYDNDSSDTSTHNNAKERLNSVLNRVLRNNQKSILRAKAFDKYDSLSADFRKKAKLSAYANKNESLRLFCESLEAFRQTKS